MIEMLRREDDLAIKLRNILFASVRVKLKRFAMNSYRQAYHTLLEGCLADGIVSQIERKYLNDFRSEHNIAYEEHTKFLSELGWSLDDFQRGYKCDKDQERNMNTAIHNAYDRLLVSCVSDGVVNEMERIVLSMYRYDNNIDSEYHEEALRKVGWTKNEFAYGTKMVPSTTFDTIN